MSAIYKELSTDRFVLNKLNANDKELIFFLRSDPGVLTYLGRNPIQTHDEALQWIELTRKNIETGEGVTWAIRQKETGKAIGNLGFWRFKEGHFRAEVGYSLHPAFQNQGIMTECMRTIIPYAFDKLNMHSICAEIDPHNTASRKLLEKLHFRKEAHFTEDYYFNGTFSDSAIYSLLKEWFVT